MGATNIFRFYKDKANKFRWTIKAENGEPIADSAQGYEDKVWCFKMGMRVAGIDISTYPIGEEFMLENKVMVRADGSLWKIEMDWNE